MVRPLSFLIAACALSPLAPGTFAQSIPDDTPLSVPESAGIADEAGLNDLIERLGGVAPTGAGVIVAMAEAAVGGAYKPNPSNSEFAGATFSPDGRTFFVNLQRAGLTFAITGPWETRREDPA